MEPGDVLDFWFVGLSPEDWFTKNDKLDRTIREKFGDLHAEVVRGEHDDWQESPEGALALVIVFDQFSRNMFRDTKRSFTYDTQALRTAKQAIASGFDNALPEHMRAFLYMPYMHSESAEVHEKAISLFTSLGDTDYLKYEKLHKGIIDRFGRYPHRNVILGRDTTEAEVSFLKNKEHSVF